MSPRRVLIIVGKKQRTAAIAIFEKGLSSPNQLFVIGENAMIGTAFAAIASGISAVPEPMEAREQQRHEDSERRAQDEAAERLLERVDPGAPQRAFVVPEGRRDVGRLRQQERLHVEERRQALPEHDSERRRRPARAASRRDGGSEALLDGGRPLARRAAVAGSERLANRGDQLEEVRVLARLVRTWLRQVDLDDRRRPDRAGPT